MLGGLIGWLASHRLRLATVLLFAAGLVPILVILIRPESSFVDIIPTVIGLALGLALFRHPYEPRNELDRERDGACSSPEVPCSCPTRWLELTRIFLIQFDRDAGLRAVSSSLLRHHRHHRDSGCRCGGGRTDCGLLDSGCSGRQWPSWCYQHRPRRLPDSRLAHPDIKGLTPFVTDPKDFYRIDTALAPPVIDPQEWSLRIHGMVDTEVTSDDG